MSTEIRDVGQLGHRGSLGMVVKAASLLVIMSSSFAMGGPTLDFSGGGSEASPNLNVVDGFPGEAGAGWKDGWLVVNRPLRSSLSVQIVDQAPFTPESKNYLQMKYQDLESEVSATSGVQRAFNAESAAGGIDAAKPYKVRFQFRLDAVSEGFATPGDLITFFGARSAKVSQSDDPKDMGWVLSFRPGLGWMGRVGPEGAPRRIGPKDAQMELGVIWTVTISVKPASSQYDVEISNGRGEKFEGADLGAGTASSLEAPAFLNFLIYRKGTGKSVEWSIDNIEVSQD